MSHLTQGATDNPETVIEGVQGQVTSGSGHGHLCSETMETRAREGDARGAPSRPGTHISRRSTETQKVECTRDVWLIPMSHPATAVQTTVIDNARLPEKGEPEPLISIDHIRAPRHGRGRLLSGGCIPVLIIIRLPVVYNDSHLDHHLPIDTLRHDVMTDPGDTV